MVSTLRFLFLCTLLASFAAQTPTAPVPVRDGFVTDPGHHLTSQQRAELIDSLSQIYARTNARINILIVNTTAGERIENFAERTQRSWKMPPDGMLMLVAWHDKNVYITVGDRLQEIVTDSYVNWYMERELLPAMQSDDIARSLSWSVSGIGGLLKAHLKKHTSPPAFVQDLPVGKALIFLCLLVLGLAMNKCTNTLAWLTIIPFPLALVLFIFSHNYTWLDPFVVYSALTPFIIFALLVLRCLVTVQIYKALGRPAPKFSHFPFGNAYWFQVPTTAWIEPGFHSSDSFNHSHSHSHNHEHSHSSYDSYCGNDSSDSCSDSSSDGGSDGGSD